MTKTLAIGLVALLALAALPLVAPAADALPECNAIVGVSPWFSYSPHGCTAGTLVVCSMVGYQNPVSPKVGTVTCTQDTTLVIP